MIFYLLTITPEEFQPELLDIYNAYHEKMIKYARSCLRGLGLPNVEYDGEDVVQNAFVKIIRYRNRINDLDGDDDRRRYVMRIVRNEALNYYRECEHIKEYDDVHIAGVTEEEFYEQLFIKEKLEFVKRALRNLNQIYLDTLSFRISEKLDVSEIADIMNISPKLVYTRLERARKLILIELEKMEYEL